MNFRKLSLGLLAASAVILCFATVILAQQSVTPAPLNPFLVDIQQTVPVSFTFHIPNTSGDPQTVTVPAAVDVYLMLQVRANGSVSPTMQVGKASAVDVTVEVPTPTATPLSPGDKVASFRGSLPAPTIIDNFQVHITEIALWDFEELYKTDIANRRFYGQSVFEDAQVFGAMNMVITNSSSETFYLPARDAVLLVGTEQVDLSDFTWVSDDLFNDALRPGVVRKGIFVFTLKDTSFAEIANNGGIRFLAQAPVNNDTFASNEEMEYDIWIPLAPSTDKAFLPEN